MFKVNEDMSIYVTRGDAITLTVKAIEGDGFYQFRVDDHLRFKVFGKKNCSNVVLDKEIIVAETSDEVDIVLTEEDTKFGDVISKPTDYWYEVELNTDSQPQTIIGYDEDGAKLFRLYPEGGDVNE